LNPALVLNLPVSNPFIIQQPEAGYRYSAEPFILADWIQPRKGNQVLDVGTGCGIIPLLLARCQPDLRITAVEIQESLYRLALQNIKDNDLSSTINILHADFLSVADTLEAGTYDWVISNPPYRKPRSGRINPSREKAVARHELTLTMQSLIAASRPLLKPEGRLAVAYPAYRKDELCNQLNHHELHSYRWLHVSGCPKAEPRFVLVEAGIAPQPAPPTEESLVMYNPDGTYSRRMRNIYESFDYSGRSHRVWEK